MPKELIFCHMCLFLKKLLALAGLQFSVTIVHDTFKIFPPKGKPVFKTVTFWTFSIKRDCKTHTCGTNRHQFPSGGGLPT